MAFLDALQGLGQGLGQVFDTGANIATLGGWEALKKTKGMGGNQRALAEAGNIILDPSASPEQRKAATYAYLAAGGKLNDITNAQQATTQQAMMSQFLGGGANMGGLGGFLTATGLASGDPALAAQGAQLQMARENQEYQRQKDTQAREDKANESLSSDLLIKAGLAKTGMDASREVANLLFKNGTLDKRLIIELKAGALTPEAQKLSSVLHTMADNSLRVISGAATKEEELDRIMKAFVPGIMDDDKSAVYKINQYNKNSYGMLSGMSERDKKKAGLELFQIDDSFFLPKEEKLADLPAAPDALDDRLPPAQLPDSTSPYNAGDAQTLMNERVAAAIAEKERRARLR